MLSATLLADTFTTNVNPQGGGWNDVNHDLAARQSGSLAPIRYVESIATGAGGTLDQLTQVNNPALPNTLRLADEPSANQIFTSVSLDRDWKSLFSTVVAGDDVPRKKPAPDVYVEVLTRLGHPPGTCLAIEDSGNGLTAARGARIPVLITRSQYFHDDNFYSAFAVVEELTELAAS